VLGNPLFLFKDLANSHQAFKYAPMGFCPSQLETIN
jgi:hypothetical protein